MKTIDTLIPDIYALFKGGQEEFSHQIFQDFGTNLELLMKHRFNTPRDREPSLRMSNIGKPDRQLWYDMNTPPSEAEQFSPETLIKFTYGDMLEQLVLMFAKLAGHDVTFEQAEVEINGVKGHIDAIIDGYVVDVKSASTYAFQKFSTGSLLTGGSKADGFGYVKQISGYAHASTPNKPAYFLAIDKTLGRLCLLEVPAEVIQAHNIPEHINHLKQVIQSPTEPPRCYDDIPDGKSGNRKLDVGCSYCSHKFRCWEGLKAYYYSSGPRYLTKVVREPKVGNDFDDFA